MHTATQEHEKRKKRRLKNLPNTFFLPLSPGIRKYFLDNILLITYAVITLEKSSSNKQRGENLQHPLHFIENGEK